MQGCRAGSSSLSCPDQDDGEAPGAVRAHHDRAADVARARGSGNEIERARQRRRPEFRRDERDRPPRSRRRSSRAPTTTICVSGTKASVTGLCGAGGEHQRSRLGDAGNGARQAGAVIGLGRPLGQGEAGRVLPGQAGEVGIRPLAQAQGQRVPAQIGRDRAGDVLAVRDRDEVGALRGKETLNSATRSWLRDCGARSARAVGRRSPSRAATARARARIACAGGERGADVGEDPRRGSCRLLRCRRAHSRWNGLPLRGGEVARPRPAAGKGQTREGAARSAPALRAARRRGAQGR